MTGIYKYPRTHHIEGSGLQPGDEDLTVVPFAHLIERHLVIEEKMDGANCAVSFTADGRLLLQSRGHYLTGGPRERQFDLLHRNAARAQPVPTAVIEKLARKLDVPDLTEAHQVEWIW